MAKTKLRRKGSVARSIQNYFLKEPYMDMIEQKYGWCWFAIPNNPEFCVALEWQGGYDSEDKDHYGIFMDETDVINVSIKFTEEFKYNGEFALYAETYYCEEGEDLEGGISLSNADIQDRFYEISSYMAEEYLSFSRRKKVREFI